VDDWDRLCISRDTGRTPYHARMSKTNTNLEKQLSAGAGGVGELDRPRGPG
jgi:hypothetical protein